VSPPENLAKPRNAWRFFRTVSSLPLLAALSLVGCVQGEVIRASHQWPDGDVRGEMLEIVRREIEAADVGLVMRIYPGQSLYKANEQWAAMTRGRLDIAVFPLTYAAGRHPEFNATLMPGLAKNHAHAQRLNDSSFMDAIRRRIEDNGVMVLSDGWLAGGFASKKKCILEPEDVRGQTIRGAGKAFEQMLLAAGGSITSMPSSEIYTAMQTGVLDATLTSSISFVSFRLYEQVRCFTAPGDTALWLMYQPMLMSKSRFERLNRRQQSALLEAGEKAEDFFREQARQLDTHAEEVFQKAGVEVMRMSPEQLELWRSIANETSYRLFTEEVGDGRELLEMALSVP
jgi:TRAP-type C4-dicarboxylate transport system substrate-binding protein